MKLKKQTLDGNIETMLLAVLVEGPSYGYQIVEDINDRAAGFLELGETTVYPVLYRLEEKGLIRSYWQVGDTNRKRRYYHLTAEGRKALEQNRDQFQRLVRAMENILDQKLARARRPAPS
jgi:PadR family transcriptional regulator, regulatory protein PadR